MYMYVFSIETRIVTASNVLLRVIRVQAGVKKICLTFLLLNICFSKILVYSAEVAF